MPTTVQQCHPETRHRRGPPCGGLKQLHLDHTVALLSKRLRIYTTTCDTTFVSQPNSETSKRASRRRVVVTLLSGCCHTPVPRDSRGPNSSSVLAPERGFEPRTLRLTVRCIPFGNRGLYSLSAAECRQMPWCAARVAVRKRLSAPVLGSPSQQLIFDDIELAEPRI